MQFVVDASCYTNFVTVTGGHLDPVNDMGYYLSPGSTLIVFNEGTLVSKAYYYHKKSVRGGVVIIPAQIGFDQFLDV